jgi:tRNA_anti-like
MGGNRSNCIPCGNHQVFWTCSIVASADCFGGQHHMRCFFILRDILGDSKMEVPKPDSSLQIELVQPKSSSLEKRHVKDLPQKQISDAIQAAPPLQRHAIRSSFVGARVSWRGKLFSARESASFGKMLVHFKNKDGVTPKELTDLYRQHMTFQADKLAHDYLGKWMVISGVIDDISQCRKDGYYKVQFKNSIEAFTKEGVVFMYFSNKWFDRLSVLKRGKKISVLGQIKSIEQIYISLDDCEIMEPG